METQTIITSREQVDAVFSNHQRAILVVASDKIKVGDVVRLVSDEPDINKRRDVFRIATHRSDLDGSDADDIISLRPLTAFEKEALRTPDSSAGL